MDTYQKIDLTLKVLIFIALVVMIYIYIILNYRI